MSGHTPGPWSLEFNVTRAGVIVADGGSIAAVWPTTLGDPKDLPVEANARLIAAAPELLEALESVPADADFGCAEDFRAALERWWSSIAMPAIKAATGGAE